MNDEDFARIAPALASALGPVINAALADDSLSEILVNPDGRIWIDRASEGRRWTGAYLSRPSAERVVRLLAHTASRILNPLSPRISGTLPGTAHRFQAAIPPVSPGPVLAIRKRASRVFSLRDYADQGSITQRQLTLLEAALRARKNVIVAGAAGSGKTTFANALLGHDAVRSDRIVLIEDTPELQCGADDLVTLTTCPSDPVITLRDLVQDALRLRPDRIIVGEVRDGSALELLKAWNTGHPGGIATLHANSARDVLYRLEELVAEVATAPANTLIGRAVDVIVFIGRTPSGRRIEQMLAVASFRDGSYVYADPEESREGEVDPSAAFTR